MGDRYLRSVEFSDQATGSVSSLDVGGVFVMIGAEPNTAWFGDSVAKDGKDFVCTGMRIGFAETPYAASLTGVYAVEDVWS